MLRGKSLAMHTAELLPTVTQEVDVTLEQAGSWPVYCEGGRGRGVTAQICCAVPCCSVHAGITLCACTKCNWLRVVSWCAASSPKHRDERPHDARRPCLLLLPHCAVHDHYLAGMRATLVVS